MKLKNASNMSQFFSRASVLVTSYFFRYKGVKPTSSIKMKPGRTRIPQDSRLNGKGTNKVLEKENYYYKIIND